MTRAKQPSSDFTASASPNDQIISKLRSRLLRLNRRQGQSNGISSSNKINIRRVNNKTFQKRKLNHVKKKQRSSKTKLTKTNNNISQDVEHASANVVEQNQCSSGISLQESVVFETNQTCARENVVCERAPCETPTAQNINIKPIGWQQDSKSSVTTPKSDVREGSHDKALNGRVKKKVSFSGLDSNNRLVVQPCSKESLLNPSQEIDDLCEVKWDYRSPDADNQLDGRKACSFKVSLDPKRSGELYQTSVTMAPGKLQQRFQNRESVKQGIKWLQDRADKRKSSNKEGSSGAPAEVVAECCDNTNSITCTQNCYCDDVWPDDDVFRSSSFLIEVTENPERFFSASSNFTSASPKYLSTSPKYSSTSPNFLSTSPHYSSTSPKYSSASPKLSSTSSKYSSTSTKYSSTTPNFSNVSQNYSSTGTSPYFSSTSLNPVAQSNICSSEDLCKKEVNIGQSWSFCSRVAQHTDECVVSAEELRNSLIGPPSVLCEPPPVHGRLSHVGRSWPSLSVLNTTVKGERECQNFLRPDNCNKYSPAKSDVNYCIKTDANYSAKTAISHSKTDVNLAALTDVSYSAKMAVNHFAFTDVSHSAKAVVNHSANTDVNHSTNTVISHSANMDVSHSANTDVSHSANTDVSHSANTYVSHSANTYVNHSANTYVSHSANTVISHCDKTDVNLATNGSTCYFGDTFKPQETTINTLSSQSILQPICAADSSPCTIFKTNCTTNMNTSECQNNKFIAMNSSPGAGGKTFRGNGSSVGNKHNSYNNDDITNSSFRKAFSFNKSLLQSKNTGPLCEVNGFSTQDVSNFPSDHKTIYIPTNDGKKLDSSTGTEVNVLHSFSTRDVSNFPSDLPADLNCRQSSSVKPSQAQITSSIIVNPYIFVPTKDEKMCNNIPDTASNKHHQTGKVHISSVSTTEDEESDINLPEDFLQKLLEIDEVLDGQIGSSTSTTTTPFTSQACLSSLCNVETSTHDKSFNTASVQTPHNFVSDDLTNMTLKDDCVAFKKDDISSFKVDITDNTHSIVPKLSETIVSPLFLKTDIRNTHSTNSPRRFTFKKIISKSSKYTVMEQKHWQPSLSSSDTPVKHLKNDEVSVAEVVAMEKTFDDSFMTDDDTFESQVLPMLEKVEEMMALADSSQVKCSPEEIEQKRQAALQRRSLQLSQMKKAGK